MKKLNLLLTIFVGLSILSCSSNNDESNNIGSIVGIYNLISIESNIDLDPDVIGEFNDKEIFDNISCTSTLTVNSNGSINWNYLELSQSLNSNSGTISYSEIECQKINGGSGQYEFNYDGITFTFDPSINVTSAFLTGNFIKIRMNKELVVNVGGQIQLMPVQLTFTYEE